ncbi:hypothetical protein [Aeoliella mucimassa]|uniref:Uncharacterized protein n=1 Tax=Aeoliella mucimassa TaxID=2527972 RepID=A0A518ALI2_9BACT|nr:hypothetical protein [Aeoliella mucimassa]QDU55556.1 hypothetical protein Pan181_17480 [Aeoliella mucimassa]
MSGPAYVHNIEAIERVRQALAAFAHQADEGLTEVGAECRRLLDWLEHDRPRYWKRQVQLAWDQVEVAKKELHRCLMFPIADERPSCTEQRAALKKAQAHLIYCQEKAERLKGWCREVRHELYEYEGRISQLKSYAEIDVVQSMAVLSRILDRIQEYQSLGSPSAVPKLDVSSLLEEEVQTDGDQEPADSDTKAETDTKTESE